MKKTYTAPACTVVVLGAKENLMQPSLDNNRTATKEVIDDPYSGGGSGYARETVRSRDAWEEW
jgi:hypothetical protein